MITEKFANGNSLIHHLDPRFKIVAGVLLSSIIAILNNYTAISYVLFLAIFITVLSKIAFTALIKRLILVNSFIGFLWIVIPFTHPGTVVFQLSYFTVTLEGLHFVTIITLKTNALILIFITHFSSSNIATIGHAFQYFKLPSKFISLLLFTYRYIDVMQLEYFRLLKAAKVRCFIPGTNFHTYKTYAYFIGMLIVNATNRGEKIHHAMICRCFSGKYFCLQTFKSTTTDWSFLTIVFINLLIIGGLEWGMINP
jgi:cobalt/nickel transport system permease protein